MVNILADCMNNLAIKGVNVLDVKVMQETHLGEVMIEGQKSKLHVRQSNTSNSALLYSKTIDAAKATCTVLTLLNILYADNMQYAQAAVPRGAEKI